MGDEPIGPTSAGTPQAHSPPGRCMRVRAPYPGPPHPWRAPRAIAPSAWTGALRRRWRPRAEPRAEPARPSARAASASRPSGCRSARVWLLLARRRPCSLARPARGRRARSAARAGRPGSAAATRPSCSAPRWHRWSRSGCARRRPARGRGRRLRGRASCCARPRVAYAWRRAGAPGRAAGSPGALLAALAFAALALLWALSVRSVRAGSRAGIVLAGVAGLSLVARRSRGRRSLPRALLVLAALALAHGAWDALRGRARSPSSAAARATARPSS